MSSSELSDQQSVPHNSTSQHAGPSRPDGVSLVAIYHFVSAAFFLFGTLLFAFPTIILAIVGLTEDPGAFIGMFAVSMIALASMALAMLYLIIGYGVWKMRPWGRLGAIALAVVSVFFVPIGTLAGALIIWYMLKPEITTLFETR